MIDNNLEKVEELLQEFIDAVQEFCEEGPACKLIGEKIRELGFGFHPEMSLSYGPLVNAGEEAPPPRAPARGRVQRLVVKGKIVKGTFSKSDRGSFGRCAPGWICLGAKRTMGISFPNFAADELSGGFFLGWNHGDV